MRPSLSRPCRVGQCAADSVRSLSVGDSRGINLVEGTGHRRRRCVDAWMSDDREKLVQAWPRNASDSRPLGQLRDASKSCLMERGIFAMRIDENIRIERDHAPRSL